MRENPRPRQLPRRYVLVTAASATLLAATSRIAFAALTQTPRQTPGPYYPKTLPLDRDNDLARITGHPADARGTITHVFGRLLDTGGKPIPSAKIEIWQCDSYGRYHNVDDRNAALLDPDFQG